MFHDVNSNFEEDRENWKKMMNTSEVQSSKSIKESATIKQVSKEENKYLIP
jgi:hypothetical protein